MLNQDEKRQLVEALHEKLARSKIVVLTAYKGLNVERMNDLRRKLRSVNVEYQVVKNTLLIRASENTDAALLKDHCKGATAIAMSYDDPVAPAKVLSEFAKDNENLEIKMAVMGGKLLDKNGVKSLSALPSREILLGQVLSAMIAVPASLVRVLNNIPAKLLYALQAIKEQKEAA